MINKLQFKERFEKKFAVKPSGCWEWQHNLSHNGYGLFPVKSGDEAVNFRAHRFSYEVYKGPIPDGLMVMHKCDNRKCVNPEHLDVGTAKDNAQDAKAKGRLKSVGGVGGSFAGRQQDGENNLQAILSASDVHEIRRLYADLKMTQREIGAMYGVNKNTIQAIISGRAWKNI